MDVTISYLTLACAPWPSRAKHGILARARAAAGAGLTSLGVDFSDLPELRKHKAEILSLVKIPECEWVHLGVEDRPYRGFPSQFEPLRILAGEFGVTRVNAGVCDWETTPQQAARSLEALALDTQELGMKIAVEPVAFGNLPMTIDVCDVIKLAGDPENAGLLIDTWQLTYPSTDRYNEALPKKAAWPVTEIQLAGITRRWDDMMQFRDVLKSTVTPREASQERRTLREMDCLTGKTGKGMFARSWLREFNTMNAPVSYEVPRSDWRQLPLDEVVRLVAEDIGILGD